QSLAGENMHGQVNVETPPGTPFRQATRLQHSFLAIPEKRLLVWMAEHTPDWINSDHLTVVGFAAQLLTGTSYALARGNRAWLLIAIAFLVLNWFGDSMDGTLARVRHQQRPRYGFYVDHMLDSIGAVAMMGGLAVSGFMSPLIAIGLLTLFSCFQSSPILPLTCLVNSACHSGASVRPN